MIRSSAESSHQTQMAKVELLERSMEEEKDMLRGAMKSLHLTINDASEGMADLSQREQVACSPWSV
jgi:hypothetical protein